MTEVMADTTIVVADIACFDCDEGGQMAFYSKKKKGVETVLSDD